MAEYEERLQKILLDYLEGNERITIIGENRASKEVRVSGD